MTQPINLDDIEPDELHRLISQHDAGTHPLHPKQRTYAAVILVAKEARLRGHILIALEEERRAQKVYDQIPSHLRW